MKKIPYSLLLILFSTNVKSQQKETGWPSFNQKEYTVKYPADWQLDKSGQSGTSFVLFSPLENKADLFKENVNLLVQDLTGKNIDLTKYTEISEGQINTMMPNSKIIESTTIKNKSIPYHKIIYTGDQGQFHLKFEQYYWVVKNKAWILTFTSEAIKFLQYKEEAEKIMNSFTLAK